MKSIRNLLLALAACGLLAACDPAPTAAPASKSAPTAVVVQKQAPAVATWPPPAPPNTPVAANLLADNYVIVLDGSGSMNDRECGDGKRWRIESAKDASRAFVKSIPGNPNVGLVFFGPPHGGRAKREIELGPRDRSNFDAFVSTVKAGDGTPLWDSIRLGRDMLTTQAQMQRGYGTYNLVIVTDGASTDSDPGPLATEIVTKTPINIHVIGFCISAGHSLNRPGITRYVSALDPASLERGLQAVLAESETFADSQFK